MLPRLSLPELADQPWWPGWARDAMTGYLHAIISRARPYRLVVPALASLLRQSGADGVVDLCSGAGGPWPGLHDDLRAAGVPTRVTCTDLTPNLGAAHRLAGHDAIRYLQTPVSAAAVSPDLRGARTMFSALHHFSDSDARTILLAAQTDGVPFAAFEATSRSLKGLLATLIIPIAVLLLMPAVRPRDGRALWLTYLPPLLPLAIWWDGLASTMRTATVPELQALVASLPPADYRWRVEEIGGGPLPILAVLGVPGTGSLRP